jgi:hypothetical protein
MSGTKFNTKLDLTRQSEIYTGETACYDGGMQLGIPFGDYPSGVDTSNFSYLTITSETGTFTGTTATTTFDIYGDWTEPAFSDYTSGLTTPITNLSADTQIVTGNYVPTLTTIIDGNTVILEYSAETVTYSFDSVERLVDTGGTVTYTGLTTATLSNYIYGSLDYTGSTTYMNVKGRTETEKLSIKSGATIGYVWTCISADGDGEWAVSSSADTNTFVTGGTLNGSILTLDWNTGGSADPISLSGLTFTGNTSGNCITDFYVTNIYGCSPITIHDSIHVDNFHIKKSFNAEIGDVTFSGAVTGYTITDKTTVFLDNTISGGTVYLPPASASTGMMIWTICKGDVSIPYDVNVTTVLGVDTITFNNSYNGTTVNLGGGTTRVRSVMWVSDGVGWYAGSSSKQ